MLKRKVITVRSKEKGNSLTVGIIDNQVTVVLGGGPKRLSQCFFMVLSVSTVKYRI